MCGECCTRYTITVTQYDARRIAAFTGLNPTSFLTVMRPHESVADTYFDSPKIVLSGKNNNILALKEAHNACMFLENNQCSIYRARPLVCRPFPFTYSLKGKSDAEFTLNKEAQKFCKGIGIGSEKFDFSKLKKTVLTMETERDKLRKRVQNWNEKVTKGRINRPRLSDLIEFLLPPTKQQC
jgi:Fe-S-cluster containining protein